VIRVALPAKSVARTAALASAVVGATALVAPAAHASGVGEIFLYRKNAGVLANCTTGTKELRDDGDVSISRYIYGAGALHSSTNGDIETIWRKEYSATRADKQYWCYKDSFYNEYFAANQFSRTVYQYWGCYGGGCAFISSHDTAWTPF
jgi:hypothetical protein